jgi:hypothetical protein
VGPQSPPGRFGTEPRRGGVPLKPPQTARRGAHSTAHHRHAAATARRETLLTTLKPGRRPGSREREEEAWRRSCRNDTPPPRDLAVVGHPSRCVRFCRTKPAAGTIIEQALRGCVHCLSRDARTGSRPVRRRRVWKTAHPAPAHNPAPPAARRPHGFPTRAHTNANSSHLAFTLQGVCQRGGSGRGCTRHALAPQGLVQNRKSFHQLVPHPVWTCGSGGGDVRAPRPPSACAVRRGSRSRMCSCGPAWSGPPGRRSPTPTRRCAATIRPLWVIQRRRQRRVLAWRAVRHPSHCRHYTRIAAHGCCGSRPSHGPSGGWRSAGLGCCCCCCC